MSSGPGSKSKLVSLSPDEFNSVVKRVHSFLMNRAERAKDKFNRSPSEKSEEKEIEAAKDVFVFVHMMELIEHMAGEIHDLRDLLSEAQEELSEPEVPEMYSTKKGSFVN